MWAVTAFLLDLFCEVNDNLAECLGGQIGGVPPLANRVEKSVCLEIIVARILS